MKKIKTHIFFCSFLMMFIVVGLFGGTLEVSANAHPSIQLRDGNATWTESGYRPSPHAQGAKTHARDVDPSVVKAWTNNSIVKGGKFPESIYNQTRGTKISYDIYQGTTDDSYKKGWNIITYGSEAFFRFDGWSVLDGYYHHDKHNQATYIGVINKNNRNDRRIYKTEILPANAGKDLEWDKKTNTGEIRNKCPNTGSSSLMRHREECNMEYKWVGFRAYLPLEDLFKNGNEEWELYIVKAVKGTEGGTRLVYDRMVAPFEREISNWENGRLTFDSGEDRNVMVVTADKVIRRTQPRSLESGSSVGYFTKGLSYRWVRQDESSGVAVWHGLRTDGLSPSVRYINTNYLSFGGDTATLSWKKTIANVKIQHIDKDTNVLLGEDKVTREIGKTYQVSPKTKGVFKDADGRSYVASPARATQTFNEVIKGDRTITFYYRVDLPDPSKEYQLPDTTDGKVNGKALWELRKQPDKDESYVYSAVNFTHNGTHFATRNEKHKLKIADKAVIEKKEPIAVLELAKDTKNKKMSYEYVYEYTNHYRDNYECVDKQGESCFKWEFKDRTPVWDKGKKFSLADQVKKGSNFVEVDMDHKYGETITAKDVDEIIENKFLVGKMSEYKDNTKKDSLYYEEFEKVADEFYSNNELKTQSSINIKPDSLNYSVTVPSKEHEKNNYRVLQKGLINGFYFPVEVDESLKNDLENHSSYDFGDYNVFLQQEKMTDKGMVGGKRLFEMDFVSDYFFVSENTGFVSTYPYAYQLNRHLTEGDRKPTESSMVESIENQMKRDYFGITGETFDEKIIGISNNHLDDVTSLQKYYIPISPESELIPNEVYTNKLLLKDIGLNNLVWQYEQDFSFEHYLFGSGYDDAWIIEQSESKVSDFNDSDVHTIVIKDENKHQLIQLLQERTGFKLHEFRVVDRDFVDKLKGIIGDF